MHRVATYRLLSALILSIIGSSGTVAAQDYSKYYTVTHAKDFVIDSSSQPPITPMESGLSAILRLRPIRRWWR